MKSFLNTLFILFFLLFVGSNLYATSSLIISLPNDSSNWVVKNSQNNNLTAPIPTTPFDFVPTKEKGVIGWDKFPEFSLPFPIVWQGPHFNDTTFAPLKHGFTHLNVSSLGSFNYAPMIPAQNRALLWTGVAYEVAPNQPWKIISSPWNNDTTSELTGYKRSWKLRMKYYADYLNPSGTDSIPNVDIIIADIENSVKWNESILALKGNALVPDSINQLSDEEFIRQYKTDMAKLHNVPLNFFRDRNTNPNIKLSTYSEDSPFPNLTVYSYNEHTWDEWITDRSLLSYLVTDQTTHEYNSFYNNNDWVTPSAYYWFHHSPANNRNYLAYLLYLTEGNSHWSTKDIVPFVWLHYEDMNLLIEPHMAEATAIFPFFSGAKGLWLYEEKLKMTDVAKTNYATYEYFIKGLYRLSQHNHILEGAYKTYIPEPAHYVLVHQDRPIWRGIVSGSTILIAAHNPYASKSQKTRIPISHPDYPDWSETIELLGKEVYLEEFNMESTAIKNMENNDAKYTVFPNPANDILYIESKNNIASTSPIIITISAINGKFIMKKKLISDKNSIDISHLSKGVYVIKIDDSKTVFVQQLIKM